MDDLSRNTAGVEVHELLRRLRRHWWVLLLGALLGAGAGAAALQLQGPTYTSTASVLVETTGATDKEGGADVKVNLDTEVQLIRSQAVAGAAGELLRSSASPDELVENLEVFVPPNAGVMEVSYSAVTAVEAQQGAHAFAQAYLETRSATARGVVAGQVEALDEEIAQLQESLQTVTGQIAALPADSPDRAFAEAQRSVLVNQITQVQARISPLRAASTNGGSIINDSVLPTEPAGPAAPLYLGSGLLGGLLLALGVAALMDLGGARVSRAGDVEALGLPVMVDVPRAHSAGRLVVPTSPAGQAYMELRNLVTSSLGGDRHVVAITGASTGAGAAVTAANLALALARAHHSVVVVTADASSDVVSLLGAQDGPGLAELLRGESTLAQVLGPATPGAVRVCGPGRGLLEELDRLQSDAMYRVVAAMRQATTFVVLLAPSTATGVQAQSLSRLADCVLVVAEAKRTRGGELLKAAASLRRAGAELSGVVVTRTPKASGDELPLHGVSAGPGALADAVHRT